MMALSTHLENSIPDYSMDEVPTTFKDIWTWADLRRGAESISPFAYFQFRYYEKWLGGITGFFLDKGYITQEELDLYLAHRQIWEQCYKDHSHNFDYTISYEELFKMDELCGVPLKQYHEEFTLKLNSYTEEELEECKQQTGLEDNYEIC